MRWDSKALVSELRTLAMGSAFLLWGGYMGQQVSLLVAAASTIPYAIFFIIQIAGMFRGTSR